MPTLRILLQKQRVLLLSRRHIPQIIRLNLRLRQQSRHPQRTPRILRPQKLILPHRRLRTLRIMQPTPLLRQQLRHFIHRTRRMHILRSLVIHRPEPIHRRRVIRLRPALLRNPLQHLPPPLRQLPRRQLHTRSCLRLSLSLHRSTRHHQNPAQPQTQPHSNHTPPRNSPHAATSTAFFCASPSNLSLRGHTPHRPPKANRYTLRYPTTPGPLLQAHHKTGCPISRF